MFRLSHGPEFTFGFVKPSCLFLFVGLWILRSGSISLRPLLYFPSSEYLHNLWIINSSTAVNLQLCRIPRYNFSFSNASGVWSLLTFSRFGFLSVQTLLLFFFLKRPRWAPTAANKDVYLARHAIPAGLSAPHAGLQLPWWDAALGLGFIPENVDALNNMAEFNLLGLLWSQAHSAQESPMCHKKERHTEALSFILYYDGTIERDWEEASGRHASKIHANMIILPVEYIGTNQRREFKVQQIMGNTQKNGVMAM